MMKQIVQFEHKIEDFVGHFYCAPNTPLPMAKEMLFQFLKELGQIEDNEKARQAAEAPQPDKSVTDEAKVEEEKIVPIPTSEG